jgi:hypothetical protein
LSLKNLIEHERWPFAHPDEATCPTIYDIQRYRDVREHNASIDYIQGAAEQVISERDELLQELRDLVCVYQWRFTSTVAKYYRELLKKYGTKGAVD